MVYRAQFTRNTSPAVRPPFSWWCQGAGIAVPSSLSCECERLYCRAWPGADAQWVSLPSSSVSGLPPSTLFNVEQVVDENRSAPISCPALKFQSKEVRGKAKGFAISSESALPSQQGDSWRAVPSCDTLERPAHSPNPHSEMGPLRPRELELVLRSYEKPRSPTPDSFPIITQELSPRPAHRRLGHLLYAVIIFACPQHLAQSF